MSTQNFPLLSYSGAPTSGVDEKQNIEITGTPAGGSFTLDLDGVLTAAIAYNASALTVQNALQLLSNVEAGDVECDGGSLPGTSVNVTLRRRWGARNVTLLVATSSLTGGTNPAINITTPVPGVRGTHRGAQAGAFLQDITNGLIYQNLGDEFRPQWSEYEVP
jgi:hypothetical protein